MCKLKQLVLYREKNYSNRDVNIPSIEENMHVLSEGGCEKVLKYMWSGKVLIEFVSPTTDPYCPKDQVRNVIMSDGVYVWDGVIMNWVEKYKIRLPEIFLDHIDKSNNGVVEIKKSEKELMKKFKSSLEEVYI